MPGKLFTSRFLKLSALGLALSISFFNCSKSSKEEPGPAPASEYELKEIHYSRNPDDKADTIVVKLKGITIENPEDVTTTRLFSDDFDELIKTSKIQITNLSTLPKDVDLEKLAVLVPERWYPNDSYDYFSEKFTLSAVEQQKPYGAYKEETMNVTIPPKSKIVVDRQINAFYLTRSLDAVIENKTTGQRYTLEGTWKGISHYNNAATKLTQYPLGK